ncbi:MAG: class I SAM-dependent methyltransferase [Verrucomicrobia bacterium]|nr:class I SAM-dependent methyltransferase [Verrucomicrobiota bacterium]
MSALVCRACGSPNTTVIGRKPGEFLKREFAFHACRDCEFIFVDPFSGFEIYNDAYYRGAGPDPYVDYETEYRDYRRTDRALEFADLFRLATSFFSHHPPQSSAPLRWLDFGCGAGGFLKFLREQGSLAGRPLELTGHDVGSYAELLKTTDGFRILDFDEVTREPSARYDLISLIEVIEHIPDPASAIALVARLLKPGGLLLLTTGNLDSPIARRHVRYHGAVVFKVVKSLRHRRALRALANLALKFPPFVRLVDILYGVSAMPCAVKRLP